MPPLSAAEIEARLRALPSPPTDRASVQRLVLRLQEGMRACPTRVRLDPVKGVVGDRWGRSLRAKVDAQVTLMRADVAALLCGGDDYELLGDNIFATLDTSAVALPPGTRLLLGTASCEVTEKPHTGCSKFARRVGRDALVLSGSAAWRPLQLRGVHLRVIGGGEVAVGDTIEVLH